MFRAETQALQRELAGLSERYSHKCLQLNRAEQNNGEREREISRKERDLDQLRKENLVSYQRWSTGLEEKTEGTKGGNGSGQRPSPASFTVG